MKFDDYRYERPDVDAFKQAFTAQLGKLNDSATLEEQKAAVTAINKLRSEFDTMQTLAASGIPSIRPMRSIKPNRISWTKPAPSCRNT